MKKGHLRIQAGHLVAARSLPRMVNADVPRASDAATTAAVEDRVLGPIVFNWSTQAQISSNKTFI